MNIEELIQKGKDLINANELEKSLIYFQNLNKNNPQNSKILISVAYLYMRLNNFLEASKILDEVLIIDENMAEAFFYKAICFQRFNEFNNSITFFDKAINLNKDYHLAYINLGTLQKFLGQYDDAINTYLSSLNHKVKFEEIYVNLSEVYIILKKFDLAQNYAKKAIEINVHNHLALNNLATCKIYFRKQAEAIELLENAKKINNEFFGTYFNLGLAYKNLGDYKNAIKFFEDSIKLNPEFYESHFTLSEIQLSQNNFLTGWANYEYRWNRNNPPVEIQFSKPKWEPKLGYKKLLIWEEQGIGDQILFSNILNDITDKFEKIYLLTDNRLVDIYKYNFPQIIVLSKKDKINENSYDYHLPMGSLGLYFKYHIDQFELRSPLFKVENKMQIKSNTKLNCALSWKSKNKDFADSKSIELNQMKEILSLEDISFFNIQYSDEKTEIENLYKNDGLEIKDIKDLDTFNDLNGLISFINSCDFTITVSNTNAHLSAALGKPTYLLLPNEIGKFWYWENEVDGKNIWYPSIKKFKQSESYSWDKPIRELKEYLKQQYNLN